MSGRGLRMSEAELASRLSKRVSAFTLNQPPVSPKPNKMRNIVTEVDGVTWASRKEAERYRQLKIMALAGEIKSLRWHHCYPLRVNGELICEYFCDFDYFDKDGKHVIEDVKGCKTGNPYAVFRLKAKLMHALYGITVAEL